MKAFKLTRISVFALLFGGIFFKICAQDIQLNEDRLTTTLYFVRHAEKIKTDSSDKNPSLTAEGFERATNWSRVFKDVDFDIIYSTNFKRTQLTAKPTADSKNLPITNLDYKNLNFEEFINQHKGQTVLVVGHSNTTPYMVNKITGNTNYEDMNENDNGSLFVVQLTKEGKSSVIRLHIN
ncbi:phosphoglycerate mutase family protein [Croceivirga lutea]|uniref:phosphoglycerate mutase family protein n=1 Tax=Croceivirga lutea TaxID=1775167 RepID=UPI00163A44E0|nr:phosphoglycerate mutase family protein [Croceivirga lutea]